jgi:hypothetical protein
VLDKAQDPVAMRDRLVQMGARLREL